MKSAGVGGRITPQYNIPEGIKFVEHAIEISLSYEIITLVHYLDCGRWRGSR